jgi:hypothetical protein
MSDIAKTNPRTLKKIENPFTAQNESIGQVSSTPPNQYQDNRGFNNESAAAGPMGPQSWLAITVYLSFQNIRI